MVQPTVETRASTGATPLVVGHYLWKAAMGGIERLVLDLADEQRRSGAVDPTIVFGSEGGAWREHYDAHRVEVVGLKSGAQLSLRAYTRLRRIFERLDVLHMHAYHPLVGLAAAHSGTPVVFTLHGGFGKGR
ncbi:MAG: glycosyltransferase family 4 protein, partial [Planctomycetota bacterium]|nr:glycosyltransferase family 4 protein [Planctomycetota bacterium]